MCFGFTCGKCLTAGELSYSDQSSCTTCDSLTTSGIGTDGDCKCSVAGQVLIESDITGTKYPKKFCQSCPPGTAVISTDTVIAGKTYDASKYICQKCPDPMMSFSVSSSGVPSCSCAP